MVSSLGSWVQDIRTTYVEAEVVVEECSTSIDHFYVVQFVLVHRLKDRDLRLDTSEIQFSGLVWIHAVKLYHKSIT